MMKVIYMGSPEEVILPLQALLESEQYHVLGVISQPPKPMGRSSEPVDPQLAKFAKVAGLKVFQPERASAVAFISQLKTLAPDVCVTAAYGQILSQEFLKVPKRGVINIHPSLLPAYRGATPVASAIKDGLKQTGVTILFSELKLDSGNIILQEKFRIDEDETADQLTRHLFQASAPLLIKALELLEDPKFSGTKQDESLVSYCSKIKKSDGQINWLEPSQMIYNKYRAFFPWPGSFTVLNNKRIQVEKMQCCEDYPHRLVPGELKFEKSQSSLIVGTGDHKTVKILRLKPEGKNSVDAVAFWNGLKDKTTVRFSGS